MAFANYLDMFSNLTDSFQLIKDRTTYKQPLPINLSIPDFDSSLLHAATNLKNFVQDYTKNKEIFDLEEVKITSMQGTHIFRRDRTTQLIKCTPLSSRLHPHPIIIKKMRTFLEVKGKLSPIPQPSSNQHRPPQPDTNPNVRKVNEAAEKEKKNSAHQEV